jgi:hypothetical protein
MARSSSSGRATPTASVSHKKHKGFVEEFRVKPLGCDLGFQASKLSLNSNFHFVVLCLFVAPVLQLVDWRFYVLSYLR